VQRASLEELVPKGPAPTIPSVLPTGAPLVPCGQEQPGSECIPYGILESRQPPAGFEHTYVVRNQWVGQDVTIYAGLLSDMPDRGTIMVFRNWASSSQPTGEYRMPPGSGSVRIVAVEGNILTLASDNGVQTRFDATALRFLPVP